MQKKRLLLGCILVIPVWNIEVGKQGEAQEHAEIEVAHILGLYE